MDIGYHALCCHMIRLSNLSKQNGNPKSNQRILECCRGREVPRRLRAAWPNFHRTEQDSPGCGDQVHHLCLQYLYPVGHTLHRHRMSSCFRRAAASRRRPMRVLRTALKPVGDHGERRYFDAKRLAKLAIQLKRDGYTKDR